VDSGFTLAASALRGDRRLIAIVLGEPSLAIRNRDASALLEAGFAVLDRRGLGQAVTVASALPSMTHPALRVEPEIAQGASDEGDDRPPPVHHTVISHHGRTHARMRAPASTARHHHETTRSRHTDAHAKTKTKTKSTSVKKKSTKKAHRHHR
jgi:D-alanyl-D-alanine carboxypeptidase